jgi:cupin fold WbuC family metalloprotein
MKKIDKAIIDDLFIKANASPRKRAHFNLHEKLEDPVQRLCVAANSGAYIRPHRHDEPYKWEMFVILFGKAAVLLFDEKGFVTDRVELSATEGLPAIEIQPLVWHTLVIISDAALLVEIKPGPYTQPDEKDFAPWAPAEKEDGAVIFEHHMKTLRVGDNINFCGMQ